MTLTIDYRDGGVDTWYLTTDGVERLSVSAVHPLIYVGDPVRDLYGRQGGQSPALSPRPDDRLSSDLESLAEFLAGQDAIAATSVEHHRQTFRTDERPLLRIDVRSIEDVSNVARRVHQFGDPTAYTCYNVDLSREFRFCLETGTGSVPDTSVRDLCSVHLQFPAHESGIESLPQLRVDGERVGTNPRAVAETVATMIANLDPDVLVVDTARVIPLLFEAADVFGLEEYSLGRLPGYQTLAGASTYTSYGRVGHSPARYNVPGRVIIDRSNSFFFRESGLEGCLDLVRRSGLPMQELGWASMGRVLTAMQIREARSRGVLVPWNAWRPEFFKSAATLDDADRGGTTLAPEVGFHEDVHELDFSSLYPNIIRTRNISPETVRCGCCENEAVPGLGYSICEEDGYLPDVLGPLIDGRDEIKRRIAETDDLIERERLEARSSAIKWILVSCFGYQGFSNAKYGRIECHETINAFAREILLDAKAVLEDAGWRVLHGIVDSIWVTPMDRRDQEPLDELAASITAEVGIELEYEAAFDWVAFCPRRNSQSGALTRYFGRRADTSLPTSGDLGDAVKTRGIEARQHSTPAWIVDLQRDAVRVLDRARDPEAVCDLLHRRLATLRAGEVDPEYLIVTNRVSKSVDDYSHETVTVAALKRARMQNAELAPGQSISYVVVDDDGASANRIRLDFEALDEYDSNWYEQEAIRAVESVLSPLDWHRDTIKQHLATTEDARLVSY